MEKYTVTITETLTREVVIEAANEDIAEQVVANLYFDGLIVLDSGDYHNDVEIDCSGPASVYEIEVNECVNELIDPDRHIPRD